MNVRKPTDYSAIFAALNALVAAAHQRRLRSIRSVDWEWTGSTCGIWTASAAAISPGSSNTRWDYTDRRNRAPAKPLSRPCGERSRSGSEGYEACGDDFETTWRDVLAGCQGLLEQLKRG